MSRVLLIVIVLLAFGFTTTCAIAQPQMDANKIDVQSLFILPGILEPQRAALLNKIKFADDNGVGVKPYVALFLEMEDSLTKGATKEDIESRIGNIERALNEQLQAVHQYAKDDLTATSKPQNRFNAGTMNLAEARNFIVVLINKDRRKANLSPVTLDKIASECGQRHTDEMVTVGYLSHWDTGGKKPTQRYTEGGGVDDDSENLCYQRSEFSSPARINSN
ncbi:MAG TPA: hypothetical protein V6C81_22270 [Planktothrix sp.]|jgi:hypothetical protein